MELEEMQTLWHEMSSQIEKQKKLTDSIIIKMTRANYKTKISKIAVPETIATFVCLAQVIYILANFNKLNTWYLVVCGIVSLLFLVLLPIFSLRSIGRMRSVNILDNNYKQALSEYAKGKMEFVLVQKLSFYLTPILMIAVLPVMLQIIGGKDFFLKTNMWLWYLVVIPVFFFFARPVFRSYMKAAADAGNILKELES